MTEKSPWKLFLEARKRARRGRFKDSDGRSMRGLRSDLWWLGTLLAGCSAAGVVYLLVNAVH